jgi:hypothetical protein
MDLLAFAADGGINPLRYPGVSTIVLMPARIVPSEADGESIGETGCGR